MEISKIITRRRKELHMTQRELAEKLNVTDKTISRWEVGKSYPDATILPALAKVLNTSIDELFGDTSNVSLSLDQQNNIDYKQITRFRIFSIISIALLITGFAILAANFIEYIDSIVLYAISFIFIIGSIVLMVVGIIWHMAFYKEKFYTKVYKTVMIKWIISYVDLFVFFLGLIPIFLYIFDSLQYLTIFIVLIAEITMVVVLEKHGYNLDQKDKKTFIISSLVAVVLLSLIFCYFIYYYLPPIFFVVILLLFMIFEFVRTFKFYGTKANIQE